MEGQSRWFDRLRARYSVVRMAQCKTDNPATSAHSAISSCTTSSLGVALPRYQRHGQAEWPGGLVSARVVTHVARALHRAIWPVLTVVCRRH